MPAFTRPGEAHTANRLTITEELDSPGLGEEPTRTVTPPADAVALGLFLVIVVMVAYVRNVIAREGDTDGGSSSRHDEGEDAHPGEDSNLPLG